MTGADKGMNTVHFDSDPADQRHFQWPTHRKSRDSPMTDVTGKLSIEVVKFTTNDGVV